MDKKHLLALLSLLDEPSDDIFKTLEMELVSMGVDVIPTLEKKWESVSSELAQNRIVELIHKIQFNDVKQQLKMWAQNGGNDLFYGAYLVAKYHFPNLSYEMMNEVMNIIRRDIWFEINDQQSALEKIRAFNRVFFSQYKFQRNPTDLFSIKNSLINSVLESKRGNDISLGILYMVLCQRLSLPVYGVNLPINFITAYMNVHPSPISIKKEPKDISSIDLSYSTILFFINPFIDGVILSKRDIDLFLEDQNIPSNPSYFRPTNNIQIINILLHNLESCYDVGNSLVNVDEIQQLSLQLL